MADAPERTTEGYYRQWLREISLARDYESVCLHEDKLLAFMLQRDDLVTELRTIAERYALLRDAVNEWDADCDPDCDSYGHTDTCKHVDMAYTIEAQQAEIVRLRAAIDECLASECDSFPCIGCALLRAATGKGENDG